MSVRVLLDEIARLCQGRPELATNALGDLRTLMNGYQHAADTAPLVRIDGKNRALTAVKDFCKQNNLRQPGILHLREFVATLVKERHIDEEPREDKKWIYEFFDRYWEQVRDDVLGFVRKYGRPLKRRGGESE